MKTNKKNTELKDLYCAIAGARVNSNSELHVSTLANYAVATCNRKGLIELLDIAPEQYTQNKGVRNAVDHAVVSDVTSAEIMHLKALRKLAIVAEEEKETIAKLQAETPEDLRESNAQFVKIAIARRNLYSGIMNSLYAQVIKEEMSSKADEKRLEEFYAKLENAKNNHEKYNIPGLTTVEAMFTNSRDQYWIEARAAGHKESLLCQANAHLIDKDFCLPKSKDKYDLLGLFVTAKISGDPALDYHLTRCKLCDNHITNDTFNSYLDVMHRNHEFSTNFINEVEGYLANILFADYF